MSLDPEAIKQIPPIVKIGDKIVFQDYSSETTASGEVIATGEMFHNDIPLRVKIPDGEMNLWFFQDCVRVKN